jgi:photosystem II stability/assembly factor-like uncharacterized protein
VFAAALARGHEKGPRMTVACYVTRTARAAALLAGLALLPGAPVAPAGAASCNPPRVAVGRDELVAQVPKTDPKNASTVEAATRQVNVADQFTNSDYGHAYYRDAVTDPANPNRVYAVDPATLMRSDDGGCTWHETYHLPHLAADPTAATAETNRFTQVVVGKGVVYLVAMPFHSANGYEAVAGERIHVLRGDGKTFAPAETGLPPVPGYAKLVAAPTGALYLDVNPLDTYTGPAPALYRSTDGAKTWTAAGAGPPPPPDGCCAVDPLKPTDLWGTVTDARDDRARAGSTQPAVTAAAHSTDGGATWTKVRPDDDTGAYAVAGIYHRVASKPARLLLMGHDADPKKPSFYAYSDDAMKHVHRLPALPADMSVYDYASLDDPYGYNGLNYAVFGARDDLFTTLVYKVGPSGSCYQAVTYDGHRGRKWKQLTAFLDPAGTDNQYCQPAIFATAPGQQVVRYLVPTFIVGGTDVQFAVTYQGRW